MYYYAQIDLGSYLVVSVSALSGPVEREDMIPIPEFDESLLLKTYDPETGTFN